MRVPLLRDLQQILGADVVAEALRQRLANQQQRARAAQRPAPQMQEQAVRIRRDFERFAQGGALEFEMADAGDDADEVAVNVTSCAYAALMERLEAGDLGSLLICGEDYAAAAMGGMHLERTQTQMEGASHCDFRFRPAPQGAEAAGI